MMSDPWVGVRLFTTFMQCILQHNKPCKTMLLCYKPYENMLLWQKPYETMLWYKPYKTMLWYVPYETHISHKEPYRHSTYEQ